MEKYRKIKVVGKGNFGHAVLVQSNIDRKYFIMKVIDVMRMDAKQKEEAVSEVKVLKEMRHPYIVTYRESFIDKASKCLCIVMDYADGGDLYTKIAQQKKIGKGFTEEQILEWFLQICLGLRHIHSKKILHRDLKTQNIFLTSKGEVKIGDFGIARVLQHTYDSVQTAIGTPYYLSPEICQEKPYNQKSDIWSLGCILYEMLTLRHAFDANSMKGLVLKILKGVYPPISPAYSEELRGLVAEILTRDPNKRPSIRQILEKPFLKPRVSDLIAATVHRYEMENGKSTRAPLVPTDPDKKSAASTPAVKHSSSVIEKKLPQKASEPEEKKLGVASSIDSKKKHDHLLGPKIDMNPLDKHPSGKKLEDSKDCSNICDNEDEYASLIESLKKCLEPGKDHGKENGAPEDEDFCEREDQRVFAKFLTPEGGRIPGTSEHDSIAFRIEALKVYLEKQLGEKIFMEAYKYLQEPPSDEENNAVLNKILGKTRIKFLPLLYQLLVCEDTYYTIPEK